MPYSYYYFNTETNIVELYFEFAPLYSIRNQLKKNGWRYNPEKKNWYSYGVNAKNEAVSLGAKNGYKNKTNTINANIPIINFNNNQLYEKSFFNYYINNKIYLQRIPLSSNNNFIIVILGATNGHIVKIGITDDFKFQDEKSDIYWINREISQSLLENIIKNKEKFNYKGEEYNIIAYSDTLLFKTYENAMHYFDTPQSFVDIWIYKLKMPCYNHQNAVKIVTTKIHTSSGKYEPINVYFCSQCKKYYLNLEQYTMFAHKYGLPLVKLNESLCNNNRGYEYWKEQSLLNIMGYNVNISENLQKDERQAILCLAIKSKTLSRAKVLSFLEFLIHNGENNDKLNNACDKWRDDAEYVRNFNIDIHTTINGIFKANK